jgi:hypothetical protein
LRFIGHSSVLKCPTQSEILPELKLLFSHAKIRV